MKIAFIYDAVYPWVKGGAEKRVYELAKKLVQRGHEVHWYSIGWWWPENGKKDIMHDGIHLHGVSNPIDLYSDDRRSIKEALIFSLKLARPLMRERFDVVDCQGFPFFSCFTAKFHEITGRSRLVITLHEVWGDYWYEYLGKIGIFGKLVERAMLSLTDNFITVSNKTDNDLKAVKGQVSSIVIPNGIDFNHIQEIEASSETSDVIFAGRLIKEKNVDILLRSLPMVVERYPNLRCLIVGDGPERVRLEELAEELKVEGNVIFKGFMDHYDELLGLMKSSKVFVLPSVREGFGMVVVEANSCGLPVVVVDHEMNAAVDLIMDGVNGFKAHATPEEVAAMIIESIRKKDQMADVCVETSRKYDWDMIVDDLEGVYRELMEKH